MKAINRTPELKQALIESLAHWRENEKLPADEAHIGSDNCAVCKLNYKITGSNHTKCDICPLSNIVVSADLDKECCNGLWAKARNSTKYNNLSDWPVAAKAVADFIETVLNCLFPEDSKLIPPEVKKIELRDWDFGVDKDNHLAIKMKTRGWPVWVQNDKCQLRWFPDQELALVLGNLHDLIEAMLKAKKARRIGPFEDCTDHDTVNAYINKDNEIQTEICEDGTVIKTIILTKPDFRQFCMQGLGLCIEEEGQEK
jgi:hypothetical protein